MAAGRYTSRVFVIGEALKTKIAALTIPAFQTKVPKVEFGSEDPDMGSEKILVALGERPPTDIDWVRFGPAGRDEIVTFDVVHRLLNPNIKTTAAVWDRLEAVSTLIESVIYDTTTETAKPLGFTAELLGGGLVVGVRPDVWPGPSGFVGENVVSFRFMASI